MTLEFLKVTGILIVCLVFICKFMVKKVLWVTFFVVAIVQKPDFFKKSDFLASKEVV